MKLNFLSLKFYREVRDEFKKLIWPSWNETKFTTIMVLVFAFILSVYLLFVDQIIFKILKFILGN